MCVALVAKTHYTNTLTDGNGLRAEEGTKKP